MPHDFDVLIKNAQLRSSSGLNAIGILSGRIAFVGKDLEELLN